MAMMILVLLDLAFSRRLDTVSRHPNPFSLAPSMDTDRDAKPMQHTAYAVGQNEPNFPKRWKLRGLKLSTAHAHEARYDDIGAGNHGLIFGGSVSLSRDWREARS
jgi:hypothetical protein